MHSDGIPVRNPLRLNNVNSWSLSQERLSLIQPAGFRERALTSAGSYRSAEVGEASAILRAVDETEA